MPLLQLLVGLGVSVLFIWFICSVIYTFAMAYERATRPPGIGSLGHPLWLRVIGVIPVCLGLLYITYRIGAEIMPYPL